MITEKELKKINYGPQLKEKLEQLGVGASWKDGKKKSDIIADALGKLAILQSQKDAGANEQEAKEALQGIEEEKKLIEKEKEEEESAIKANAEALEAEKLKVSADVSKEEIQKNIKRVLVLLKTANIAQKEILSKKLVALESQLKQ